MKTAPLTTRARTTALEAMRASTESGKALDVLVVGGGVTGAGIALDAVSRGLSTAIVEAQDWAGGSSSRSTKLAHGGLRYLQMLDFKLVHEALTERDLLTSRIAPHLVRPTSFLYPLHHHVWERAYVGAGIALYDILASATGTRRAMPLHKHIWHSGVGRMFPDFRPDASVGAIQYWDAMVDDARLVETLVRTAVSYGAHAASRTQVVGLTTTGTGAVTGARLVDHETGDEIEVAARAVINATGVWTEKTESLAGSNGGLKVLASKGIHVIVPRGRIRGDVGLILQTEKSVLFFIPWPRYWVIGTTDTPWKQDLRHPVANGADIDYVLDHANAVLTEPLTRDDVIGVYAGLRPLLQREIKDGTDSAKASREHTVASPAPGLTVIAGGKLTTYRVMAKDAVDFALGSRAKSLPSPTHDLPLVGAEGLQVVEHQAKAIGDTYGWAAARMKHLVSRYGSLLSELTELVDAQPDLAKPLTGAAAYTRAEVVYAATHEGALHLDDVLMHRTRLNFEQADKGLGAIEEIADLLAPVLQWDEKAREREVQAYRERVDAEEAAALEGDDASAEAVRLKATDLSPMFDVGEGAGMGGAGSQTPAHLRGGARDNEVPSQRK